MTRKEVLIAALIGVPAVLGVGALSVVVPNSGSERDRREMTSLCFDAASKVAIGGFALNGATFNDETRVSKRAVSRFRVSDTASGFECQIERAAARTMITRLVIDGEDRTQDLRLKEQN